MILQQMKLNKISLDGVDDKGDSLLHDAVRFEAKEIVKILLNEGSDENIQNAMGLTPKEIANQLPSTTISDIFNNFNNNNNNNNNGGGVRLQLLQADIQDLKSQIELVKEDTIHMKKVFQTAVTPFYSFLWENSTKSFFIHSYEIRNIGEVDNFRSKDDLLLFHTGTYLQLWDLQTGECKFSFDAESDIHYSLFFFSILSAGSEIKILNINTGSLLISLPLLCHYILPFSNGSFASMAPVTKQSYSNGFDIQIWDRLNNFQNPITLPFGDFKLY